MPWTPSNRPPPQPPPSPSTPSSSAPACPACTSSTACASWACGCGCSRPAPASAAPGTGTATRAPASIPKATPTATRSPQELLDEWNWTEHFAPQPETLRYLNHVADKFDLRRDIQFRSRVTAAHYQEATRSWDVDAGGRQPLPTPLPDHRDRPAVGPDHAAHRRAWTASRASPSTPRAGRKSRSSFAGKRVAVIGTGATGVQTIQEVAKTAGHLTVFQRTPNWCAPLHNGKIDADEMAQIKAGYPEIFARCQETFACFLHTPDPRGTFEVTPEEREAFWEKLYAEPGFGIWQGNFRDILTDREANAADHRLRRQEDPPAGEGPGGRGEADPEEPRLRHPPRAAGDALLRGLQPAQCRRWWTSTKRRSSGSRPTGIKTSDARISSSTSSSTRPASMPSPALRPHRHPRRGRRAPEGQLEGRAADLSRRPGRRLPQHDDAHGAAYGARQHSRAASNTTSSG